ncbi:MAG TPA: hypothetical protein VFW66_12285 [Gemmatimonadales bacterium]|nr:hypothetical protein [Gemmatimonadales bacterium]
MSAPGSGADDSHGDASARPDRAEPEAIRSALIRAALDGYERAAMSGLCCEGAWEAAVAAMRAAQLPVPGGRSDA